MRNYIICTKLLILLATCNLLPAQVGINTALPMDGTSLQIDGNDSGVLINRVALTGLDDITTIPSLTTDHTGLMVFNTATTTVAGVGLNVAPGFYYWTGTSWLPSKNGGVKRTGWVSLTDANLAGTVGAISDLAATDPSNFADIPINFEDDAADNIIDINAPTGLTGQDFFDSTTSKIKAIETGDSIMLRLQFNAIPQQNNAYLILAIDISNDPNNPIIIFQKTIRLLRGARLNRISETILLFQLATFKQNGAKIKVAYNNGSGTTGGGNFVTLSDFSLVINRLSSN
ncbi:hypothetical protein [Nonlabens ponticola]|uniref:Uncharacterized protein n=1 Tax=Nonlabens ponticola TaxID=2496866 RepID=A0A3S9MUB6_9FLAO|nr:hypothetical protein [Nonlabens ponticola]AZQ42766.1 hypothetical protein EJ995_00395 [Nonlabens ponticola]